MLQQREASSLWVVHGDGAFILFDCSWNGNNKCQDEQYIENIPPKSKRVDLPRWTHGGCWRSRDWVGQFSARISLTSTLVG